jgi:serine O-acetyltransferase
VVIGETAVIGNHVKLYQGVTLGALSPRRTEGASFRRRKRHPTIEDNVTIYSGATILGDTIIGEGCVIGGNVWLVESVPPRSKVLYDARVTHTPRKESLA